MPDPVVVSLFSGAGGLSKGFADAGMRPVLAAEIDRDAVATYTANVSEAAVLVDIGQQAERIVSDVAHRCGSHPTFAVIGGPPCQGFSTAGARDHKDPRNSLVFSYLEIVERLRPSWFLFENVEGILTSGGGDAVVGLAEHLTKLGYSFRIEKVNFARWGLPQARKRVLIVGNRHGIDFEMPGPAYGFEGKKHRASGEELVTLGDAIAGLPAVPAASLRDSVSYTTVVAASPYDARMRTQPPGPKAHTVVNFARDAERIRLLKPGHSLRDLSPELWPDSYRSRAFRRVADGMPTEKRGGAPSGLRRLDPAHASLTITGFSPRELIHPEFDRPLTLRECARLQSFPDGFNFHGGFQSIAQQIGNAFPPMVASLLATWMRARHEAAGADTGNSGVNVKPGLLGYRLTEASAMSPVLRAVDGRLNAILTKAPIRTMPRKKNLSSEETAFGQANLFSGASIKLSPQHRSIITKSRRLGAGLPSMQNRELVRMSCIVLRDLGYESLIPEWARDLPSKPYFEVPLEWFVCDADREIDFHRFYLQCVHKVEFFETIFHCMSRLHARRRRFELILRSQPIPTMDQVGRRGLLEYGRIPVEALTSWLTWRKWIYDIDNRSAQETGLLYEPILAASLGGESVSARKSPVRNFSEGKNSGRQVDCLLDLSDSERFAYEFKDRVTIAAAGKGRFKAELSFPADARASGYTPILLVMDPTSSKKLTELTTAFTQQGGRVFLGDDVWEHIRELSGPDVAKFVQLYVRKPVAEVAVHEERLLELGMRYEIGDKRSGDKIKVTIGKHSWVISRPPREEAVELPEDDAEDVDEGL